MAFQEIKLDFKDMLKRAFESLGYTYKHGVDGPNVFDKKDRPVCILKQAKFWPEGDVCLYLKVGSRIRHVDAHISLSENEEDLLAGCPVDEEFLH